MYLYIYSKLNVALTWPFELYIRHCIFPLYYAHIQAIQLVLLSCRVSVSLSDSNCFATFVRHAHHLISPDTLISHHYHTLQKDISS